MSLSHPVDPSTTPPGERPVTLPLTIQQYSRLVDHDHFAGQTGQIELINGRIVQMNPQGPQHSDPIDLIAEWSIKLPDQQYRVRVEKPIELPESNSVPEPDIAWVTRKSYAAKHPQPEDVLLLIEASFTSIKFDLGEKLEIYARSSVPEYWQLNIPTREIRVHRDPQSGVYRSITTYTQNQILSPVCLPTAKLMIADLFA